MEFLLAAMIIFLLFVRLGGCLKWLIAIALFLILIGAIQH